MLTQLSSRLSGGERRTPDLAWEEDTQNPDLVQYFAVAAVRLRSAP